MRNIRLLAGVAFGAALLAATPGALAQQQQRHGGKDYGFIPPPGTPMTPGDQGGAGLIPPVSGQYRAARMAEANARQQQVGSLLRQADAALSRGNGGLANEYLERAETALLNTDTGSSSGAQDEISGARQALMNRDREGARQHIRTAMGMTGGGDAGMSATGADSWRGAAPMQGGGGPGMGGSDSWRSEPMHGVGSESGRDR